MKTFPIQNAKQPEFDRKLIACLSANGPRYTSYPTADRFHTQWGEKEYVKALELQQTSTISKPISLYVHIPFCNTICYYCGCNKIITKDKSRADDYIHYLSRELELLAPHLNSRPILSQLHFGGGTPTFLNNSQLEYIFSIIAQYFQLNPEGEYSIEIDPRKVSRQTVFHLRKLGFNRMSIGIQDFDPKVQAAVNRIQSIEETREIIEAARASGFKSVSVDLIYGLPHQSLESIKSTIDTTLSLNPDRLALYHYAHLPHLFKPQRRIDPKAVPDSEEKLDILQYAVQTLTDNGYEFIGMDHFAKPTDELTVALHEGRLQRNFQGYSTYADCDLIAIGISGIGKIGNTYSQNEKDINVYYAAIDSGHLPIARGYQLNQDDILRRNIIQDLMCRFSLDFQAYQDVFDIHFHQYFKPELHDLAQQEQLGLLQLNPTGLTVTPKGRFLIRNIAMIFDHYLRHKETKTQYSQTV